MNCIFISILVHFMILEMAEPVNFSEWMNDLMAINWKG
jgi:hypothetical protein